MMRRLLHNRPLQFFAAGALIFALSKRPEDPDRIQISAAELSALASAHASRTGAPRLAPSVENEILSKTIEDEVLYREALRMGLDKSDNVVRTRLIQKVIFLAEDLAGATRPAQEADLRAYYEATKGRWQLPESIHLIHVFATPDHAKLLEELRPQVLNQELVSPKVPPPLGDAFPLSRDVSLPLAELAQIYGKEFAEQVYALPLSIYAGPLRSRHGLHLVKVLSKSPKRQATFEEVRGELPLAYLVDKKREAVHAFVKKAVANYRLEVAGKPFSGYQPSNRIGTERGEGAE